MSGRFSNNKKYLKLFILCFTFITYISCPLGVSAGALQDSTDESIGQREGWVMESSAVWYYDDNEPVTEGWHYLPTPYNAKHYQWFYFLKDGLLYNPPQRPPQNIEDAFAEYTGVVSPMNKGSVNYEYSDDLNGWHFFKLSDLTEESGDKKTFVDNCYYIKNTGPNDYSVCRFYDNRWYVLDASGSFLPDNTTYPNNQKWNVVKNSDGTYTFINKMTSEALCLKDNLPCPVKLYDIKATSDLCLSEKVDARPEFFGAEGDGVSDDTFPIYHAINNSDEVLFSNTYNTTRTIDVKRDGVTIKGDGGCVLTHTDFRTFMVKGKDVTFDSITFQGNYSKDEASDNSSIFFITEKDDGDVVDYNAVIKNCKFIKTGHRCIHIHSARTSDEDFIPVSIASGITIKDCLFDTYKLGVCCSGPDDIVVDNCTFKNSYYEHITFDWRSRNCKAVNNHFVSGEHGVGAIGLDTAENIEIKNNDFTYTDMFGVTLNNEAGKNKNIVISGNRFKYGGGFGGIYFQTKSKYGVAAEDVSIVNNIFDNANSDSVILNSAGGTVTFSGNKYLSGKPVVKDTDATVIKDF